MKTKQLSIYDVYVKVTDQEQADRLKQICIDYNLPYWDDGFLLLDNHRYFGFSGESFWLLAYKYAHEKTQITESEFIELIKQEKR